MANKSTRGWQSESPYEAITHLIAQIGPYWNDRKICHIDGNDIDVIKKIHDELYRIRDLCEKPIDNRRDILELLPHYQDRHYETYDDYDAINCDKVADIPIDYDGAIGVPITVLDRPEIMAHARIIGDCRPSINGKTKYRRILIEWTWHDDMPQLKK